MPGREVDIDDADGRITQHIALEGVALDGEPADGTYRPRELAHVPHLWLLLILSADIHYRRFIKLFDCSGGSRAMRRNYGTIQPASPACFAVRMVAAGRGRFSFASESSSRREVLAGGMSDVTYSTKSASLTSSVYRSHA